MVYYLSDELNFKISNKIGLGEVEGFLIVTRSAYYRTIRAMLVSSSRKRKDRFLVPVKLAAVRLKASAVELKNKTSAAAKAFKG